MLLRRFDALDTSLGQECGTASWHCIMPNAMYKVGRLEWELRRFTRRVHTESDSDAMDCAMVTIRLWGYACEATIATAASFAASHHTLQPRTVSSQPGIVMPRFQQRCCCVQAVDGTPACPTAASRSRRAPCNSSGAWPSGEATQMSCSPPSRSLCRQPSAAVPLMGWMLTYPCQTSSLGRTLKYDRASCTK